MQSVVPILGVEQTEGQTLPPVVSEQTGLGPMDTS